MTKFAMHSFSLAALTWIICLRSRLVYAGEILRPKASEAFA